MYKWPPAVFLVSFPVLYSKIVSSAFMLIGSSVFSVGSVVFPARSLIRDRWFSALGRVHGCSFSSCIGFSSCEDFR